MSIKTLGKFTQRDIIRSQLNKRLSTPDVSDTTKKMIDTSLCNYTRGRDVEFEEYILKICAINQRL